FLGADICRVPRSAIDACESVSGGSGGGRELRLQPARFGGMGRLLRGGQRLRPPSRLLSATLSARLLRPPARSAARQCRRRLLRRSGVVPLRLPLSRLFRGALLLSLVLARPPRMVVKLSP